MGIPGSPRFHPSTQISARELQRVADLAARTERMSVTGDMAASIDDGGMAFTRPSEPDWFIRITGAAVYPSPNWFYSWETVRRSDDNLGWVKDIQGPEGLYNDLPAIEMNFNSGVPISGDNPVVRRAHIGDDGYSVIFDWTAGGSGDTTYGGTTTYNGSTIFNGPISYTPTGSPVDITGDMNNLTLIDGNLGFLNVTVEGAKLAGIVAPFPLTARRMLYCNKGTATLKITNQDPAAAVTHRIITHYSTGADILLPPNFWIELEYDLAINRWRVMWVSDNLTRGVKADAGPFPGTLNDWTFDKSNPFQVWQTTGDTIVTGLADGTKGEYLYICNDITGFSLVFRHSSASSAVGNRISCPGEIDYVVPSGGGVILFYDGVYWCIMGVLGWAPVSLSILDANQTIAAPGVPQLFAFLDAALTAVRTITLPAANAVGQGTTITFVDRAGYLGATNYLTIQRAGADTVNGATSINLTIPYSVIDFVSDGVSKWTRNPGAAGGAASLTQYQIGIGDAANLLSGLTTYTHQNSVTTIKADTAVGGFVGHEVIRRSDDLTIVTANGYGVVRSGGTIATPTDTVAGMYVTSLYATLRSGGVETTRARIDMIAYSPTACDIHMRTYFGGAWNTAIKVSGATGDINLGLLTGDRLLALDSLKNVVTTINPNTLATLASPALTGTPTAPTAAPGTNTTQIATTAFVTAATTAIIAASDAMVFKGVIDCSANPNYPAADRGHTYRVSLAGKIGGAIGVNVEVGDTLICLTDGTASGNHATVGVNWGIVQANLDGAVIGPATATDGYIVLFDGTTGKLIKNSTYNPAALAPLISPSFTTPALGTVASGNLSNCTGFPTATAGESVLGASFALASANGVYDDTGLSVSLPASGTYLVTMIVHGQLQYSVGTVGVLVAKFYNSTVAADVANSECLVIIGDDINTNYQTSSAQQSIITTAGAATIKLYAKRDSATTYTVSSIDSNNAGRTKMTYVRLY